MDSVFNSGVQGGDLSCEHSHLLILFIMLCSYGMVFAWQTELRLVSLNPRSFRGRILDQTSISVEAVPGSLS